ncbi:MAG TPA: TetR/AcrR family transcriptional regulator [Desulfatiglandales bacterium]|nr:TetR/AcrR family transcriptional regulator [Desulfatiglandales bacterium]
MPRPKNLQKIQEIYRVIARLFASRGYHSTSMREIAHELGMNKSSLYHYFTSKEDILFKLMNDAMDDALATLQDICVTDVSPEEKLKKVLSFYTQYYAGDQERLILLVNEMNSLNDQSRSLLIQKQRHYVQLIQSILKELADHGKMKQIDPAIATFAFFGMVHYTVKWYQKDGPIPLYQLAQMFVEIFNKGILR